MSLSDLGWSAHFARHLDSFTDPSLVPARVVRQEKYRFLIQGDFGARPAVAAGHLRQAADDPAARPVVGDWTAVYLPGTGDLAVIQAVLPRRSAFSRKTAGEATREQVVAANIDTLFVVMGLDGDFSPRRAERYVLQTWNSGAVPVVVLSKSDLCLDVEEHALQTQQAVPGVEVLSVSGTTGEGIDTLRAYTGPGTTVAFVGSSGVGKSTLVNALLGREEMRTNAVRESDSKGRHTTTHRELLVLPGGGALIDTPGMRELQLWTSAEGLDESFQDIESLAAECRFRDCTHRTEPGCAVLAALETGELDAGRYRGYQKLRRELEYLARRQDESGVREEKQRDRKGSKLIREINRRNPKR